MTVLILVSRPDPASATIRDALLDMEPWKDRGAFEGLPVGELPGFLMVEVDRLHLECDHLDARLRAAGLAFDAILVASKHKAESGKPALTVHPIGNLADADFGGLPRRLVPTAPRLMSRVLRRLAAEARGLKHQVTFEATHHGPYLETPTAFVEIGTDERSWADRDLGRRVARALLAADEPSAGDVAPTLVMVGGSHYAPRASDLVRNARANVGHIIPGYALERGVPPGVVLDAIRQTPGCQGYYLDERLASAPPEEVLRVFGGLELGRWTDAEL
ncbi:MAG TPA: D-aminoacyl-tRNA deacylase [Candidatus Thermoplasmatota archaeon]|nr:D-aminoacyl-tRNA deacylase [Candidatus Thermoplasmatota archaeon]